MSEILGLSVDLLTADEKYSRHNRRNLLQPIQMLNYIILKTGHFLWIFYCIFRIYIKFGTFSKTT